jgi:hypothetical protein
MGLFDFLKSKKTKPATTDLEDQRFLLEALSLMGEDGCDTDEIPGGVGEFGYNVDNPIPTKTPLGSAAYLERLRDLNGAKISFVRRGSTGSSISEHPIDAYTISGPDGGHIATLFISAYHKRNSNKAPRGFLLK